MNLSETSEHRLDHQFIYYKSQKEDNDQNKNCDQKAFPVQFLISIFAKMHR
ncbi:MAG: hypothetical protein CI952_365, partial [Methanohalophilus sp.]